MIRYVVLAIVILAVSVPSATAAQPEDPHVDDEGGDIQYSPAYLGDQNHDYLDVDAAWFAYDSATDEYILTIQVVDATMLAEPPEDWLIEMNMSADIKWKDDTQHGYMEFWWTNADDPGTLSTAVRWNEDELGGFRFLDHRFALNDSAPGQGEFRIPRPALLAEGDVLHNFEIRSWEEQPRSDAAPGMIMNYDNAEDNGNSQFVLTGHGPADDDNGTVNGGGTPGDDDSGGSSDGGESPGLNGVAVAAAFALAGVLAMRFERRR